MNEHTFSFDEENFSRVFPFYILIDENLTIASHGKSISKLCPLITKGNNFSDCFRIKRPFTDTISVAALNDSSNQLVLLEHRNSSEIMLRGQIQKTAAGFLFVGSPWFVSMDDVNKRNLLLTDFAHHDPLLDLLQILRTQQATTAELSELLKVNTRQKDELKKDREELNKLSVVASANRNGVVFTHPSAEIFWCNEAYTKITGFSTDEVIGRTPIEVGITEKTDKEALGTMIDLFYKGKSFDVEVLHGRKNAEPFWARIKGQPIYNDKGELQQYFAMIEDMTAEKEKEEQLVLLSLIAERNINAVIICDKEGKTEWVNSSFCNVSGYTMEELKGKKPGDLLQGPESDPQTIKYLSGQIEKGEPFNCEILNYTKQGKKYWIKIQGQALYNNRGELIRYFAIQEDISGRKQLEAQKEELLQSLAKSNKELEDYAQIVSHDLKSPLRSINSLMTWIKEDNSGKLSEDTLQYFGLIDDKLEKMDHLIQGILTYSKIDKTDIAKENVNLQEVIKNTIDIIDIPPHVTVTITDKLPVIRADRYRMQQLFQNLIANAVLYIDKPEGIVEVGCQETDKNYIFSVKDNGPGIAKENHEKIFKIFQSLTNNEKSTGLGLSIVKKIVDNYKGEISIESEPGKGTTFYIKLKKTKAS